MGAHVHVSEEPEGRIRGHLIELARHPFDFLVVRRHPEADQAEGRWQTLVQIHAHDEVRLGQQMLRHEEPCGPGAHNGGAQRPIGST